MKVLISDANVLIDMEVGVYLGRRLSPNSPLNDLITGYQPSLLQYALGVNPVQCLNARVNERDSVKPHNICHLLNAEFFVD